MAMTNNYCTLAELKSVLGIDALSTADTADDSKLEIAIMSVSRWIDGYTGRRFYTSSAAETRAYSPTDYDIFFCPDDINDLDSIRTDVDGDGVFETAWAAKDYSLEPRNAALDGKPYTYIRTTPAGDYTFPHHFPNSVQLVGKFGWCATSSAPDNVKQACLIQASRIFKRKDAPFGIVGSAEFGTTNLIPGLDPDVKAMLISVTRRV